MFPIVSQWELYVAMKARVLIRSGPNPYGIHFISLWQITMPLWRGQFGPRGHGWLDLIKGITKHCYTQNTKALGLMGSEKIFVLPILSLCKLMTHGV